MPRRTLPVACLSCGYTGKAVVDAHPETHLPQHQFIPCPKCRNPAWTGNPLETRAIISMLVKEVVRLKMDLLDLQGAQDGER